MVFNPNNPNNPSPEKEREAAIKIIQVLQEAGHVAYFAGGCVRDMLLAMEPIDYDVATDARPDDVMRLFQNVKLVGEAFGVALVRLMQCEVEVATFRTEWGYSDGRHPDHVDFSDAEHDAMRRDFTINGIFYDPIADKVHDYVGGQGDLLRQTIRGIGDPHERFGEDYLRILRAVRFAAKLGWKIEEETIAAILEHGQKLEQISRERIAMEIAMMLSHRRRADAVDMLNQYGLDGVILTEPHSDRPPTILRNLPDRVLLTTALAAWLLDRHLPTELDNPMVAVQSLKVIPIVRRWREALILSNEHTQTLLGLLRVLPDVFNWQSLDVPKRKRLLARKEWPALRRLLGAMVTAMVTVSDHIDLGQLDEEAATLFEQGVRPDPFITGDDLIASGLKPSPMFKQILEDIYDAQLDGRVTNKQQALALAVTMGGPTV